jgi:hypothetical protein
MNPKRPAVTLAQHLKVASRLRGFDYAKRELLPGHRQIDGVVAGDL